MNIGIALGNGKAFGISVLTIMAIMLAVFFLGYKTKEISN
jgi:hypothetical protein